LAVQDGDLVAQSKDLGVLVALAHRQKPQGDEQIHDRQIDQPEQHERS
jgi:hypothetical protein